MLSWLDEAGALLACQEMQSDKCVIRFMDKIDFIAPGKINEHITIYGKVLQIGNTSITLHVYAKTVNPITKKEYEICKTDMVFVDMNRLKK